VQTRSPDALSEELVVAGDRFRASSSQFKDGMPHVRAACLSARSLSAPPGRRGPVRLTTLGLYWQLLCPYQTTVCQPEGPLGTEPAKLLLVRTDRLYFHHEFTPRRNAGIMTSPRMWAVIAFMCALGPMSLLGQVNPSGPSRSLDRQLQALLDAGAANSSDPELLLKVSDLYLDIGDEVERGTDKRVAAYEAGARLAKQAWQLQDSNAEAHYLYAANLGSAAQLKGVMASALTVRELKAHVARALTLRSNHAPSLHMMGMMLEELPWVLGGNKNEALVYLKRAVAADPDYDHARLDLAKAYLKRHDSASSRHELAMIVNRSRPSRHLEEAKRLLATLDSLKPPTASP